MLLLHGTFYSPCETLNSIHHYEDIYENSANLSKSHPGLRYPKWSYSFLIPFVPPFVPLPTGKSHREQEFGCVRTKPVHNRTWSEGCLWTVWNVGKCERGCNDHQVSFLMLGMINKYIKILKRQLKLECSIGGFEWIFINLLKSAAFSLQTSENKVLQTSLESLLTRWRRICFC